MARVFLTDVSKVYPDGFQAVKNFNLDIKDQEFIVFVGPSGCGKSTTLRMIAGLEDISSGTLRIGERDATHLPPKDRDIAMVFQSYALYPHMTVFENMAFALSLRKLPKEQIAEKVIGAARMLGIEPLLERKPKALSGGQRQRVAVGRAIVRDPQVFLFDEPLSNLDARLRVEMRAELKKLHLRLRTTTIYVTHDQKEAMTLGDRVIVMRDGLIQQVASPLEIYRRPANRFVAGFMGTPPMNFIEGRLVEQGGHLTFTAGTGTDTVTLTIPDAMARDLREHVGTEVVLGLRPQAFKEVSAEPAASWTVQVQLIEHLGDRMDVRISAGGSDNLVARVEASERWFPGQTGRLAVDPEQIHVFAAGPNGARIAGAC